MIPHEPRKSGLFLEIILTGALALALCLMLPLLGRAQEEPVKLRESIKVYSDVVTLGDIFENAGHAASAPVFRSPDLGTQGVVAARRIAEAARRHGLYWKNPGNVLKVKIERPSRLVTLKEIEKAVALQAMSEFGLTSTADIEVRLSRMTRQFHVDPRIGEELGVKRFSLRPDNGAFEAVVGFSDPNFPAPEKRIIGQVFETMEVPVPAHPIQRGQTIHKGDMKVMRMARRRVPAGIVMDISEAVGMAARRNLRVDTPIRRSDLEPPKLVFRNTLVTAIFRKPNMALKTQARVLDDGAAGQTVTLENTRSKRRVQGVVIGPGLVAVESNNHVPGQMQARAALTGRSGSTPYSVR
ncbi:MAG: flagellar basal body P-ring formation chaperone FlgA [Methyloligellaceae bacterium]